MSSFSLAVNLVVLWISETAPGHLRGSYVSSFQIFQGLGGITGAGISKGELEVTTSSRPLR